MDSNSYWGRKAVYSGKGNFIGWAWYAVVNGKVVDFGVSADSDLAYVAAKKAMDSYKAAA